MVQFEEEEEDDEDDELDDGNEDPDEDDDEDDELDDERFLVLFGIVLFLLEEDCDRLLFITLEITDFGKLLFGLVLLLRLRLLFLYLFLLE